MLLAHDAAMRHGTVEGQGRGMIAGRSLSPVFLPLADCLGSVPAEVAEFIQQSSHITNLYLVFCLSGIGARRLHPARGRRAGADFWLGAGVFRRGGIGYRIRDDGA